MSYTENGFSDNNVTENNDEVPYTYVGNNKYVFVIKVMLFCEITDNL